MSGLEIILCIVYTLYIVKGGYYLLNIYQQNHYDAKKLLTCLKAYYLLKPHIYLYYFFLIFTTAGYLANQNLLLYLFALIFIGVTIFIRDYYVIQLKMTKRIYRLIATCLLWLGVLYWLGFYFLSWYIVLYLYLLLPFILILSSFMNAPIEKQIQRYYKKKAIDKLRVNPDSVKIAITGSYGKTSTKDILYQVLSSSYVTLKTPASYNTMMGISKTINTSSLKGVEVLIIEMGAFQKGEIEEMVEAVRPHIRIITEIGPQHLSTFKSIEQVAQAKFEILSYFNEADTGVFYVDNPYIQAYSFESPYTYGLEQGIYQAQSISYQDHQTRFDIYKAGVKQISVTTSLLGRHNVINILAVYTIIQALKAYHIDISDSVFQKAIASLMPTLHRLSYQRQGRLHIYDDSYSSNVKGFQYAIEVLKNQTGIRCIITPGIVDGGKQETNLNREITTYLYEDIDEICIIKNKASEVIIHLLEEKNVSFQIFSTFKEAYTYLTDKYLEQEPTNKEQVHLLIENDLPDSFLER